MVPAPEIAQPIRGEEVIEPNEKQRREFQAHTPQVVEGRGKNTDGWGGAATTGMPLRALLWVIAVTCLCTQPAEAKKFVPPPMPAGYDDPGPVPDNLLEQVLLGLRMTLVDPYSVRDFSLCQSRVMQPTPALSDQLPWKRAYRITQFLLNTKNQFGGYTGLQAGIATFIDGKLTSVSLIGPPVQQEPAKSWREPCSRVPDAEIQRLLAS